MTTSEPYEWHSAVPHDIIERAYSASGELAWSRSDAIKVVSALQHKGYLILGVDIWLPTIPGPTIPTPFVYDWDESDPVSAFEFIQTFEWDATDRSHGGMQPYFNITV